MPTWVLNGCEHFQQISGLSAGATLDNLLIGKGWNVLVAGSSNAATTGPYSGDVAITIAQNRGYYKALGTDLSEGCFQFHYYTPRDAGTEFFRMSDSGVGLQLELRDVSGHALQLTRNGTALATLAAGSLVGNTWYEFKIKFKIANTGGYCVVYQNGTEVINFSGDTQNTANARVNEITILQSNVLPGIQSRFANIFCYSDVASFPQGELRYKRKLPSGAGTTTNFTPSTGSNYQCVDETNPSTTDYVESTTPGNIDLYTIGNSLPSTDNVAFVIRETWALKTDAGARTLRQVTRSGGTNYESGNHTLTGTHAGYQTLYATDPNTSAAWTAANVNALEIGPKDQA